MSTTPQRYTVTRNAALIPTTSGRYILFTEAEADKAWALAEVNAELKRLRDILQTPSMLRYHVQKQFPEYAWESAEFIGRLRALAEQSEAQQATIARLTKALEGVLNSAVHPDIALRAVMVDLSPVRAALNYANNGTK